MKKKSKRDSVLDDQARKKAIKQKRRMGTTRKHRAMEKKLVLTGVGERGGGRAGEVACPRRGARALEDGVEGVGGVGGEGVGQVAEAAGLDGRAVGAAGGAARVVQRRLQRLLRRAAPRDAPRGTRRPRREQHQRNSEEPRRRDEEAPAPPHVVGTKRSREGAERERERELKAMRRELWAREEGDGWEYGEKAGGAGAWGAGERISSSRSLLREAFMLLYFFRVFVFLSMMMAVDWGLTGLRCLAWFAFYSFETLVYFISCCAFWLRFSQTGFLVI